jgi:hypothetical protein
MPQFIAPLKQPQQLLARLLEEPELVRIVSQMDTDVLHKVIQHIYGNPVTCWR